MKFNANKFIRKSVHWIEVGISIIVLVAVLAGIPDVLRYIMLYVKSDNGALSYEIFSEFLKHVLMLVVGLEMISMIINHQNESILTLVLYVIARKMLVYAHDMTEILLGTVSIVLVFAILKFFIVHDYRKSKIDGTISAGLNFNDLRELHGIYIEDNSHNTIGGLLYDLSREEGKPLKEGNAYFYQGYAIVVVEMRENVIERVKIERLNPNQDASKK